MRINWRRGDGCAASDTRGQSGRSTIQRRIHAARRDVIANRQIPISLSSFPDRDQKCKIPFEGDGSVGGGEGVRGKRGEGA